MIKNRAHHYRHHVIFTGMIAATLVVIIAPSLQNHAAFVNLVINAFWLYE